MRLLEVCVGSSCHLRGSYDVIREFKRLIVEHALEKEIELKGCFCLGGCTKGVSLRVDGRIYTSITKDNVRAFFSEHFLSANGQGGAPHGVD
ncbi:MAG: (2Fe-2S) ferredoxin domain-containing protein [Bacillota bacterium]|jgi:NADH:ubiquinone oxidoreductase subunit E